MEEESFESLLTMATTFIVLFLLSLFYSTTVTLFKVAARARGRVTGGWEAGEQGSRGQTLGVWVQESRDRGQGCPLPLTLSLLPTGEVTR